MENSTVKLKPKILSVVFFTIFAILSILSLCSYIQLCVFGSLNPTPVLLFFCFIATQFICSIPQVNFRQITFDESSITIQRYIFKSAHLPYTSYQYSVGNCHIFRHYSLDLNNYGNQRDVLSAFNKYMEGGLIEPIQRKLTGKEIRGVLLAILLPCGLFVALAVLAYCYFGFESLKFSIIGINLLSVVYTYFPYNPL